MAITFVGSDTGGAVNGGTASIDLTSIALAEDDIVLAFCFATGGTSANPSGYTSIELGSESGADWALSYKVQTSTPDTSISFFDSGDTTNSTCAIAMAFRGVDTVTPLDVAVPAGNHQEDSEAPDPPSITPISNNCCIVIFGASNIQDPSVGTVTDYTSPSTHTTSRADDNSCTVASAYRILSGGASVAQNPGTWSTWSATAAHAVAFTIALRPGSATGQPFYIRDINIPFIAGNSGFKLI